MFEESDHGYSFTDRLTDSMLLERAAKTLIAKCQILLNRKASELLIAGDPLNVWLELQPAVKKYVERFVFIQPQAETPRRLRNITLAVTYILVMAKAEPPLGTLGQLSAVATVGLLESRYWRNVPNVRTKQRQKLTRLLNHFANQQIPDLSTLNNEDFGTLLSHIYPVLEGVVAHYESDKVVNYYVPPTMFRY